ncbi:MAG: CheR family methyltransferase, partial [Phycisphaerales bacterium JB038]
MHDAVTDKPRLSQAQFRTLQDLIHARSGITFHRGKQHLLESRLAPRLAALQMSDYEQYLALLTAPEQGESEFQALCEQITINETSFFRDAEQFDCLERYLLPELLQQRAASRRLRIWSAACSSGEEPYTFAILLHRLLGVRLSDWRIEILGTDLSGRMLQIAREGIYSAETLRSTAAPIRRRYFEPLGERFRIDPQVASMVHFQEHNLLDGPAGAGFGEFDLVCCRNLLIYFDETMKQRCLECLSAHLADDGCLLVGHSEKIGRAS